MNVDGPSYTADTLDRLQALGLDLVTACFIIGADAFRDIAAWRAYPSVLDRCHFAVVSRPGHPASSLRSTLGALASRMIDVVPKTTGAPFAIPGRPSILLVDAPTSPVSSTDVRRSLTSAESIQGMVPESVADHIARHALYAARGGRAH
jgi:nicotinate-nucleotide adenylyltransferase